MQGMRIGAVTTAANTVSAPKLRVVNIGANAAVVDFPIIKPDGTALAIGEIKAGKLVRYEFDGLGNAIISGGGISVVPPNVPIIVASPILYVRPDGNDGNDGSANDAAHALVTIDAALTKAQRYYLVGTSLKIKLGAAGTYAFPSTTIKAAGGTVIIEGDVANQDAYILSGPGIGPGAGCLDVVGASVQLNGLNLTNTSTLGHTLVSESGASVSCQNVTFTQNGTETGFAHAYAKSSGSITFPLGNGCKFIGSKGAMLWAGGGTINHHNLAVVGNPTFAIGTVISNFLGLIAVLSGGSVSGSAAGARYVGQTNAGFNTGGGGANFYPGTIAGSLTNGAFYV